MISNPKELIIESAQKTKSLGSSTLCILTLEEQNPIIKAAYIGDSGYFIYRFLINYTNIIIFFIKFQFQ